MKRKAVVGLLVQDDLVLSITRKDDHNDWGLPGGKVDEGETTETALRRELQEEVGILPTMIEFIGVYPSDTGDEFDVYVYKILKCKGIPKKQPEEGLIAWQRCDTLTSKSRFKQFNQRLFAKLGMI